MVLPFRFVFFISKCHSDGMDWGGTQSKSWNILIWQISIESCLSNFLTQLNSESNGTRFWVGWQAEQSTKVALVVLNLSNFTNLTQVSQRMVIELTQNGKGNDWLTEALDSPKAEAISSLFTHNISVLLFEHFTNSVNATLMEEQSTGYTSANKSNWSSIFRNMRI